GDAMLAAARESGAQAIHPGYGFLAENEAFAEACQRAKLVFIGPSPEAIAAMGDKSAAKRLMEKAGVPLVPGYHGENQDSAFLEKEAARIGYPVLIKPSAGGGGKGMRVVEEKSAFRSSLEAAKREARGRRRRGARHRLQRRWHGGIHRRAGRALLLHGDEYAPAGRAPGHRDDYRARPGRVATEGRGGRETAASAG